MRHTPGSWILTDYYYPNNIDVATDSGRLIATIECPPTAPEYDIPDGSRSECEANALLIAAAPELLAACEAFVEAWEKSLQLEKTDVALRMAKSAIADAKGGV